MGPNNQCKCRYHSAMNGPKQRLPEEFKAIAQALLKRPADGHKYRFGRVVVIGGSQSMAGAPALAGMAALRAGAGVVEVGVPEPIAATVAGFDPCLIVRSLAADQDGHFAGDSQSGWQDIAQKADVLVIGPGLGRAKHLADTVLALWQTFPRTLVLDADGLFAMATSLGNNPSCPEGPRIVTPHAGEMLRLTGKESMNRDHLERASQDFAQSRHTVMVLKGPHTLVSDGVIAWHNQTGNPGMATAGTGDVLSGIIAALVAQHVPALTAAKFGVWLHGLAGDLAADALSEPAMTAADVLAYLPAAWKAVDRELQA